MTRDARPLASVRAPAEGRRAAPPAVRVGDAVTAAHAQVTTGTVESQAAPGATATLEAAHRAAAACGEHHEAVRALVDGGSRPAPAAGTATTLGTR